MPISLLGSTNTQNPYSKMVAQTKPMGQSIVPPANAAAFAASYKPPMGVTAKSPAQTTSRPQSSIPSQQSNPVSVPVTPPPTTYGASVTDTQGRTGTAKYDGMTGQALQAPTPAPTTPTAPPTPPQTPFERSVGLLEQAGIAGNQNANRFNQQTANYGAGNIQLGQNAQDIANNYGQQIADVAGKGARFQAGQMTTGTSPVAEGNAAVTANLTAQQQQAIAQGGRLALEGNAQALTGQNQAANASNLATGQAYTGQGYLQSALNQAAGFEKGDPTAYGQTIFDPITNTFTGGNLDPQTQSQTFAQNVLNGKMTYDQAVASMGYAGNAGRTFLDNAITRAGGNPLTLQAQGAGQQSGIQAITGAPGTVQAGIYGKQTEQVAGYQSALQQGKNLQSQLTDLITSFNLNPNDINVANQGVSYIASNTSDPRYKALQNYVNDVANTYSQILTPPGGTATDTTRGIASSMLDATAKGQSLIAVMQSLEQAAQAKISGVPTAQGNIGNTQNSNSGGNAPLKVKASDGNTYGFYQDAQGRWHAS